MVQQAKYHLELLKFIQSSLSYSEAQVYHLINESSPYNSPIVTVLVLSEIVLYYSNPAHSAFPSDVPL
ncbi:MAG: hypothetical protein EZS28_017125 [Streblomastix strix]|uniref:Uncharacterized protein n=1 Tax=Streblomastix strix TaxID=222440 RepID=A0A5J4VYM2_9EUKA|nr:MAG: hypothetical protein EZS28_017125 [Streblomastix strix]